jgi:HD-GYP domain-containing protein (c-di-GMP phosphodiesterase class II)
MAPSCTTWARSASPIHILHKPAKLTDEEWVIMRKHPQLAYEMLYRHRVPETGAGYSPLPPRKMGRHGIPARLKGEDIPVAGALFAIVDVWDALTSDRPYRPAWTEEQALAYIKEESGRYFDPQVVELFLSHVAGGEKG